MLTINKIGGIKSNNELIKICRKLSKTRKLSKLRNLKDKKLFKSQKSTKLGKKLSKRWNLSNLDTKKNEPSFLILKARIAFNCLWLIFIKALILWYFDLKSHI